MRADASDTIDEIDEDVLGTAEITSVHRRAPRAKPRRRKGRGPHVRALPAARSATDVEVLALAEHHPVLLTEIAAALEASPDRTDRSRLFDRIDRFVIALLGDTMTLAPDVVTPADFLAVVVAVEAYRRIAEMKNNAPTARQFTIAAQLAGVVEGHGVQLGSMATLPNRLVTSLFYFLDTQRDAPLEILAAEIVRLVAPLGAIAENYGPLRAAIEIGGPGALDALERRETAREATQSGEHAA